MSKVTLSIPARQLKPFREAAMQEAKSCGAWVARAADEQLKRGYGGSPRLADIRAAFAHLSAVLGVLETLAEAHGTTEIRAEPHVLAHIVEAMAKCVRPKLETELSVSYNAELVATVQQLTESIGWASGEAARLHEISQTEIRAEKTPT